MIVWIWTLTAALGALAAIWNTVDAWLDLRALGTLRNGRRLIAVGWVRREAIRALIQLAWTYIGIVSLPHVNGEMRFLAVLLVATNVAVAANTVLDARDRLALRRIL